MPLKRIFASNARKRLHQRAGSGLFSYAGGLSERKPKGSPDQLPRATEERSHASPQFAHLLPLKFKNTFTFALFGLRKSRGNTNAPQKIIKFCPFLAYFVPFCTCCQVLRSSGPRPPRESEQDRGTEATHHPTKRGTQQDQPPRWCRSAPDAVSQ